MVTALCCLPQVSVYQVLEKGEPDAPGGKKLLAARLVSLQGSGWEVFAITQAVSCFTPGLGGAAGTLGVCGQELFLTHFTPSGLSGSNAISYLQSLQQRGGAQALGGGVKGPAKSPGWLHPAPDWSHCSTGNAGAGSCCDVACAAAPELHIPSPWLGDGVWPQRSQFTLPLC